MQDHRAEQEDELIRRSQAGDQDAYGILVRRYQRLVCTLVYRLSADSGLAQDIAQETFLRAWQSLPRFAPRHDGSLRAWLCRIAHNLTVDALRRRHPAESLPEENAEPELPAADPAAIYDRQEASARVQAAVTALPPASRAVLVLREYEGLSYDEIAHALDIPLGTVMSRLNYARQVLRKALAPAGAQPGGPAAGRLAAH